MRVSRRFQGLIRARFRNILYLEIYKSDIYSISSKNEPINGWIFRLTIIFDQPERTFYKYGQILAEATQRSMKFVVHDKWSSIDVQRLFSAIRLFAPLVHTVSIYKVLNDWSLSFINSHTIWQFQMDVSILELVVAGVSSMDLSRWYSFQCYLQKFSDSVGEEFMHLHCIATFSDQSLFPKLKEATIRVNEKEFSILSRISQYAIKVNGIFPIESLENFRISLISNHGHLTVFNASRRKNAKSLLIFKDWIGISNLNERYCQQYVIPCK
ncbi:unnamed protein product [Dracunculus medinensis]|uniref:FBA_2 domain-containing protein n=1 Tax=Dracunculus medinensis TaxID=318479 RepID=A0A0N4U0T8_DRAME|nr:unnamed protein product [Dracunculus medinensis]